MTKEERAALLFGAAEKTLSQLDQLEEMNLEGAFRLKDVAHTPKQAFRAMLKGYHVQYHSVNGVSDVWLCVYNDFGTMEIQVLPKSSSKTDNLEVEMKAYDEVRRLLATGKLFWWPNGDADRQSLIGALPAMKAVKNGFRVYYLSDNPRESGEVVLDDDCIVVKN